MKKLVKQQIDKILRSIKDVESHEKLRKLLKKIRVEPEKRCWITNEDWTKYVHYDGEPAHRSIFKIFKGPIELGKIICHHCDRPGCINPDHLYQGTAKDNYQDAIKRERVVRSRINYQVNPLELDRLAKQDRDRNLHTPFEFLVKSYVNRNRSR